MISLYNSLTRKKEALKPLKEEVTLYTCGPTVYDYAHIGNLRTYLFQDILKRALLYNNYKVNHVMNITDVGHLTSDEDTGEDKIEKKAKEKKQTAWEIADYYTEKFKEDIADLNIIPPTRYIKATETIKEQINLIKLLEEKGFTYKIEDGIYFDTSKLPEYGEMANLKEANLKPGARVDVKEKKNPTDFALWKFSPKEGKRDMEWDSPWGKGFPGWHTECVAMSKMLLGIPFDIHCGGVDHIPIHHTNEIAQSQAAYNKIPAKIWMHGEFLNLKEEKMSKSKGGFITLSKIKEEGFSPLSYRYLVLNAHYRSKLTFSFEALKNAQTSLLKLKERVKELKTTKRVKSKRKEEFLKLINNDLDSPKALALLWTILKDKNIKDEEKYSLALDFDQVLGLNLEESEEIPEEIITLAEKRETFRREKDFKEADKLREEIEKKGYKLEDKPKGYNLKKNDR